MQCVPRQAAEDVAKRAGAAEAKLRAELGLVVGEAERWRAAAGGAQEQAAETQARAHAHVI